MILTQEDYKILLELQNNNKTLLTQIPASESPIDIRLNSREIILPEEFSSFLGLRGDHRAETVWFRCNRYFDDVDLSKTTIAIDFENAIGERRLYIVNLKDIESEPNILKFAWVIGNEMTKAAGTAKFGIRFFSVDQARPIYTYSLNTLPIEVEILDTLQSDDNEVDKYFDFAASEWETLQGKVVNLENKAVYWNDL